MNFLDIFSLSYINRYMLSVLGIRWILKEIDTNIVQPFYRLMLTRKTKKGRPSTLPPTTTRRFSESKDYSLETDETTQPVSV